jgi:hypothetical protein
MRRVLAGLMLLAAGCGDSGPALVAVSGKVTLDKQPLAHKTIRFVPEEGTPGDGAGATTGADGGYSLIAVRPGTMKDVKGVPPGKYRVVVTEPILPIETPQPAGAESAPAADGPDRKRPRRSKVPRAYTTAETTPLKVEVPKGGGPLDLPLTSPPERSGKGDARFRRGGRSDPRRALRLRRHPR